MKVIIVKDTKESQKTKAMTKSSFLDPHQWEAVRKMHNGCILWGGVGSGKSRTGLYYYFEQNGGSIDPDYIPMKDPQNLYIITTAKKRDSKEWEGELTHYLLYTDGETNHYKNKVVIDSWNNIKKYAKTENSFFIFDEQRLVGYGAWVKSFLKIAKKNNWVLLSATPGDTWSDYIPVFIANGFYKNKTEFVENHVVYRPRVNFPQVDRYIGTGRLLRLRNKILVPMNFERSTVSHHEDIFCEYDHLLYSQITKTRWDPYKEKPVENASELCYLWRKVVNSDISRIEAVKEIIERHHKAIIFYNYDYELEILRSIYYGAGVEVTELNGHKHQDIPDSSSWVYLVQYNAGCEGWNCVKTDTIIFYSQSYSYKTMIQAAGRTDRMNTPYLDLYYYHLKSRAAIDVAISRALKNKKKFNEVRYVERGNK